MCAMKQTGFIIPHVGWLARVCRIAAFFNAILISTLFFSPLQTFDALQLFWLAVVQFYADNGNTSIISPSMHPSLESSAALWLCVSLCRYFPFLTISDIKLIQSGIKLWLCHRAKTLNPAVKCYDSKEACR